MSARYDLNGWKKAGAAARALLGSRRRLLLLNAAAWSIAAAMLLASAGATSSDFFCGTCHVMTPHVDSHQRSAHASISCADCHVPAGAVESAALKIRAAARSAAYLAGARPEGRPAAIPDARCLAPACHDRGILDAPGRLSLSGIRFAHQDHAARPDGSATGCLSCHNRAGSASHMSVDLDACFICHLRPGQKPGLSRCASCHVRLQAETRLRFHDPGRAFRHSRAAAGPDSCTACHGSVIRGSPVMRDSPMPFGVPQGATPAAAHASVPEGAAGPCTACHRPIAHSALDPAEAIKADPSFDPAPADGGGYRSPSVRMYLGLAQGPADRPDIMFRRGVLCSACHPDSGTDPAPVAQARCGTCHEKALGKIPAEQKRVFAAWAANLEQGWRRYGDLVAGSWDAERRSDFESSVALLRSGAWFHNIPAARALLERCESLLESETRGAFAPLMLPEAGIARPDRSCTWRCHLAVPSMEKAGDPPLRIEHRRHLEAAKLRCGTCHAPAAFDDDPGMHGKLLLGKPDCLRCHHAESAVKSDCSRCHKAQERILSGEGVPGTGVLRRRNCPDAKCSDCHDLDAGRSRGREAVLARCAACHKADRSLTLDAWQASVRGKLGEIGAAIAALEGPASAEGASVLGKEKLALASRQADAVRADGSLGSHNVRYALAVLEAAAANAREAAALLGK